MTVHSQADITGSGWKQKGGQRVRLLADFRNGRRFKQVSRTQWPNCI